MAAMTRKSDPLPRHFLRHTLFVCLIFFISTILADDPPPQTSDIHSPKDAELLKRELQVRERMASQAPIAVRKMSDDGGEKFFLDYWKFNSDGDHAIFNLGATSVKDPMAADQAPAANASAATCPENHSNPNAGYAAAFAPAFARHRDPSQQHAAAHHWFARSLLQKRQFQCPRGTNDCDGISRPDSCCATGEECFIVEDTGLGDVGCCPEGLDCADTVAGCDTDAGFTDCADNPSGGCCIPGYQCQDEGCVVIDTLIILPAPTIRTARTITVQSTSTTTVSVRRTSSSSPSPSPSPATATVTTTATVTAEPPLRPTAAATAAGLDPDFCPTGFYACQAIYHGGCCRIDRDCDSTSCPPPPSNTLVDTGDVVIVASDGFDPVTVTAAAGGGGEADVFAAGGECAQGWVACGAGDGGGCCPSGFECGESCVARETEVVVREGDDGDGDGDGDGDEEVLVVVAETVARVAPESVGVRGVDLWSGGGLLVVGALVMAAMSMLV